MGTANVTLYAKWSANIDTITFNKNDPLAGGSMVNQTIASGSSANLNANGFTKAGWSFAGWATTPGGTVAYLDGVNYTMGTANVTLYAQWTINQDTVTFNSNGGSAVDPQYVNFGATATAPTPDPTKQDSAFGGWYSDSLLTTPFVFSTSITSSITLYALWQ